MMLRLSICLMILHRLEELAAPYNLFTASGYGVTIASMKGGQIPVDQGSLQPPFKTADCDQFLANGTTRMCLCAHEKLRNKDLMSCRRLNLLIVSGFANAEGVGVSGFVADLVGNLILRRGSCRGFECKPRACFGGYQRV